MYNDISDDIVEFSDCTDLSTYFQTIPKPVPHSATVTFMHVNIQSMTKNFSSLLQCIDSVKSPVDVIIVTEANISQLISSLYEIDGYAMHTELRNTRKGGGIIIYVRNILHFTTSKTATHHCESLIGKLTTVNKTTYTLCALYRPPHLSKNKFITELQKVLNSHVNSENFILMGDVNIDLKSMNSIRYDYVNMLYGCGLVCGISEYTRIELKSELISKSCIDHIFARSRSQDMYSAALCTTLADHRMIVLSCVGPATIQADPKIVTRLNNKKVFEELDLLSWEEMDKVSCPNEIYKFITNNISVAHSKAKFQTTVKESKRNKEMWINNKIINQCKKRDRMYRKWKHDPTNMITKLEYNKIRNATNKLISQSKNNYFIGEIHKHKYDPKNLWKILNKLTGRVTKSIEDTVLKAFDAQVIGEGAIARNFVINFENNTKKAVINCKKLMLDRNNYEKPAKVSMRYNKANKNNINKIIINLKCSKGPGHDGIRPIDLKYLGDKISAAIAKLINASVQTGIFPSGLKLSTVRPIHKNGAKNDYGNYRPISILPTLDKIAEKFICGQIQEFYKYNKILSPKQYAFQSGRSTTILLSKFTDEVNMYLNNQLHVILVQVDYSKAFDTLQHDILLHNLENTGIRGPLLEWSKDYLSDRSYRVKVGSEYSNAETVKQGTAQGSVIGPIHYLAHVNDLNNLIKRCSIYQFADDTCLMAAHRDVKTAEQTLQEEFTLLCKWSHDVGLTLNAEKTKMMHIHSSQNTSSYDPKIIAHSHDCLHRNDVTKCQCDPLETVNKHKYLGLVIDDRFKWKSHIEYICNKLRAILAKFQILRYKIPYHILRSMYLALPESIVSYGLTSYGRTYKTYIDQIYDLQIRLLKTIVPHKIKKEYSDNYHGLFKYCKIMPIQEKIQYLLLVEQAEKLNTYPAIQHNITTRQISDKKLALPKCRNDYGKRNNKYLIPYFLNNLPTEIRVKINDKNMKRVLKRHYVQKEFKENTV